jgi:hypothetical protein
VETEMNLVNKEMSALNKLLNIKMPPSIKRRDSTVSVASGSNSSQSTLPSSSTTQSQSMSSPPPPLSPMMFGNYNNAKIVGRPVSASETRSSLRKISSEFPSPSRQSYSESAVNGLRTLAYAPHQHQYPHEHEHEISQQEQHLYSDGNNPYARLRFEPHPIQIQPSSSSKMSSIMEQDYYSHSYNNYEYHPPQQNNPVFNEFDNDFQFSVEQQQSQPSNFRSRSMIDQISSCSSASPLNNKVNSSSSSSASRSQQSHRHGNGDHQFHHNWTPSTEFCSCDVCIYL